MKKIDLHPFRRRGAPVALLIALTLTLGGCEGTLIPEAATQTPARPRASVTPAPTLLDEPAVVYTNVLTSQSVVSLILEGFTDDGSMSTTLYTFKQQSVPAVFFVSGIVANEHPETVQSIVQEGFALGNYGLNGEKDMQDNDVLTNVHQFQRGQELILEATGSLPRLFRCNGSVYTSELLQAAAHAGLEAGVKPNIFLNHTSFQKYEDALLFVQRLTRGSIISIKLGQVLDPEEYGGTTYNMDYLAIDPPPFLSDDMEHLIADTYSNITNVVMWLLAALEAEGYVVLSPEALQAERITLFDNPEALSEMTLQMLDPEAYALPVTSVPLGQEAVREATIGGTAADAAPADTAAGGSDATPAPGSGAYVADGTAATAASATGTDAAAAVDGADAFPAGTVFLGDSITVGLQNYVEWERRANPAYLSNVQFLTSSN
ncbi:MAG: polysaccharide deacetylase family protein, partial [Clostridiales bacterium]|nr:polysaccharide deacetylase family protein [Clostridiales bacterium]